MKQHKTFLKILPALFLVIAATFSFGLDSAHAQTTTQSGTPASSLMCHSFLYNIRYGANDTATNSAVTDLQNFLVSQNLFDATLVGSGHFGPVTLSAVLKFQSAHNIPATGYVGILTRTEIQSLCGSTSPPITTNTPVSLYALSPSSASTGTTVSIRGFGFTSANTILFNGNVAARNVPITSSIAIACTTSPSCHGGINQTLTFMVPTSLSPNCPSGSMCPMYVQLVTPGQYSVTVQNANGTSNPLTFTITGSNPIPGTIQPLSINGIDAPASLQIGQTGNWVVHVTANSSSSNLHYSVTWGDEGQGITSVMAPSASNVQNSAMLSHVYQKAGTYTATFTVTDDAGASTSVSNTLTVNPLYYY